MANQRADFKDEMVGRRKLLLFVCIFNVKRSVIAEHFFRKRLVDSDAAVASQIDVASAGFIGKEVSSWFQQNNIPFPEPPFNRLTSKLICDHLFDRGINLSAHRSRPVTEALLGQAHTVVPMLSILKRDLLWAYPHIKKKIVLPGEFLGEEKNFLWEDRSAVPNDQRMFEYAHNNLEYVTRVVDEIETFIQDAFPKIVDHLLGADNE